MNTQNHQPMSLSELEMMIEGYFNCTLTELQEQRLKQELATTSLSSPSIDEARAVIGLASVAMEEHRRSMASQRRRHWLAVAASIAIVAVVGVGLIAHQQQAGTCVAWVNGQHVTDDAQVMQLVNADLNQVGSASASVDQNIEQQLGDLGAAIERD